MGNLLAAPTKHNPRSVRVSWCGTAQACRAAAQSTTAQQLTFTHTTHTTRTQTHRATITDHDRAVLSLKAQRKKLEDRSKQVCIVVWGALLRWEGLRRARARVRV
jgi:hypothetical protein